MFLRTLLIPLVLVGCSSQSVNNIEVKETKALGGIEPDAIRGVLIKTIPQFRICYQNQLDTTGKVFSGVIRLDFLIESTGKVGKSKVTSSSGPFSKKTKNCILEVLKKTQFPKPLGGGVVEVSQPVNFYPRN